MYLKSYLTTHSKTTILSDQDQQPAKSTLHKVRQFTTDTESSAQFTRHFRPPHHSNNTRLYPGGQKDTGFNTQIHSMWRTDNCLARH
uniref:Uncharacterized protein n=1 Tax=Anguilla anguilla TaxID=7936 RepID=A0A0E9RKN7_ANGAN